ncbi:hypothetical protein H6790_03100 [Candidatus Nomurabacteria bacterium]|nr:hypothetical protein [Candidatus Nomurabacteria bacterium]
MLSDIISKNMKFIIGVIIGALIIFFAIKYGLVSKQEVMQYQQEAQNIIEDVQDNLSKIGAIPGVLVPTEAEISCAVQLDDISAGDTLSSPISVTGVITPTEDCHWVKFEGQGGIVVMKDSDNNEISNVEILNLEGDWMNTDPFTFDATLTIDTVPADGVGYIYFQDANQADAAESPSRIYIVPVIIE